MENSSDHDLLIELRTHMRTLLDNQNQFMQRFDSLSTRVAALEVKDRGDSERIGQLVEAVRTATDQAQRITTLSGRLDTTKTELDGRLDAIQENLNDIKRKGNWFDAMNALGVIVSGILGTIFGQR